MATRGLMYDVRYAPANGNPARPGRGTHSIEKPIFQSPIKETGATELQICYLLTQVKVFYSGSYQWMWLLLLLRWDRLHQTSLVWFFSERINPKGFQGEVPLGFSSCVLSLVFSLFQLDANLIEGELYNHLAWKNIKTTKVARQNLKI